MTQEWTLPLQISITVGEPVTTLRGATSVGSTSPTRASATAATEVPVALTASPGRASAGVAGASSGGQVESIDGSLLALFNAGSLSSSLEFGWRKALSLALASDVAYEAEADIKRITTGWRMQNCEYFEKDDTQCFICSNGKVVLLAFRGSEMKLGDWLGNLNALSTTRPYGNMHRGFYRGFQGVQKQLESYLSNYPNLPVVITGHSLGGALAVVAAAEWRDLRKGGAAITAIHTFGQPGVGFKQLGELMEVHYNKAYYRFVNDTDLVTMVPPFYKHCGRLVHFKGNGELDGAFGSSERESVGAVDSFPLSEGPATMSEADFDQLRAELLLRRVQHLQQVASASAVEATVEAGIGPDGQTETPAPAMPLADVESAVAATLGGQQGVEGFFPSIRDHFMAGYIKNVKAQVQA